MCRHVKRSPVTCYKYSITCQDDLLTVDNAQSHVTAFRPISEAARSWSDDNSFCQTRSYSKKGCYQFCCMVNRGMMGVVCQRLLAESVTAAISTQALPHLVQQANHLATEPPSCSTMQHLFREPIWSLQYSHKEQLQINYPALAKYLIRHATALGLPLCAKLCSTFVNPSWNRIYT